MAIRTPDQTLAEVIRVLQEAMRRIRNIEEVSRALEAKQASTENNVFRKAEEMRAQTEALDTALKDLNTRFLKLENEVSNIKKFLAKVALKAELEEFRNYTELLSPLRSHYVTENEVRKLIEESKK